MKQVQATQPSAERGEMLPAEIGNEVDVQRCPLQTVERARERARECVGNIQLFTELRQRTDRSLVIGGSSDLHVISHYNAPVLATWVICSQNRHLQLDLTSPLLAEKREMSVPSTKFALPHALTSLQFSRRRSSSSVWCLHLHQTPGMFLLSHPPRWLLALDTTAAYFLAARSAGRSCQSEIRTCR